MIVLLHGGNKLASRRVFTEKISHFKEKRAEIIRLDGKKVSLTEIKQACETKSFFGSNRLIVVECFFSRPKSREKTEITNYFQHLPLEINIIFWEEKKITVPQIRKLPTGTKVYFFKIEPIIFKLLDSLSPGNAARSISLLSQCQQLESAEMIFYMLCRQVRLLILAKDLNRKGLTSMPYWMQGKFLRQSQYFSLEQLLKFHRKLLQIDYEQKTGQAIKPLSFHLDLLVATL
mgnify:CR=1 FL=1